DDGKANALSSALLNELDQALTRAQEEAKAVVLLGRPGRFSGGFDLKVMKSGPAAAQALVSQGAELLMRIYEFPLPFVAACSGHAVAAGALMLLASDTRIGIEGDFKIGLNEVAIGMTVPILAQELARDRLAPTHLTPAIIQGTLYGPSDAVKVGYLDQVVAPDALVATAITTAAALGKLSNAYGATKARLRKTTIAHVRATLAADLAEITGPA
ncbi:MAG: crotonase/enoyl-CoA hydratase family protein, partial [Nannocystaceae bacterium]|nr:crotonase/enoyl-CoA hydratase family protein [Nannocystaceae bacterium]